MQSVSIPTLAQKGTVRHFRTSWYRQTQLEAVVKEYYIIKPVLKQDRKYSPFIHTMDSVILKDGISAPTLLACKASARPLVALQSKNFGEFSSYFVENVPERLYNHFKLYKSYR